MGKLLKDFLRVQAEQFRLQDMIYEKIDEIFGSANVWMVDILEEDTIELVLSEGCRLNPTQQMLDAVWDLGALRLEIHKTGAPDPHTVYYYKGGPLEGRRV